MLQHSDTARKPLAHSAAKDPWEPEMAPDGTDLSLIRSMLRLTPLERLERLQDFLDGIALLKSARKAS